MSFHLLISRRAIFLRHISYAAPHMKYGGYYELRPARRFAAALWRGVFIFLWRRRYFIDQPVGHLLHIRSQQSAPGGALFFEGDQVNFVKLLAVDSGSRAKHDMG